MLVKYAFLLTYDDGSVDYVDIDAYHYEVCCSGVNADIDNWFKNPFYFDFEKILKRRNITDGIVTLKVNNDVHPTINIHIDKNIKYTIQIQNGEVIKCSDDGGNVLNLDNIRWEDETILSHFMRCCGANEDALDEIKNPTDDVWVEGFY